jgi:hypothetical protein
MKFALRQFTRLLTWVIDWYAPLPAPLISCYQIEYDWVEAEVEAYLAAVNR